MIAVCSRATSDLPGTLFLQKSTTSLALSRMQYYRTQCVIIYHSSSENERKLEQVYDEYTVNKNERAKMNSIFHSPEYFCISKDYFGLAKLIHLHIISARIYMSLDLMVITS